MKCAPFPEEPQPPALHLSDVTLVRLYEMLTHESRREFFQLEPHARLYFLIEKSLEGK
jgi:hypothetical protein